VADAARGVLRLLIALDGSRTAERALSFVGRRFPPAETDVTLISVLDTTDAAGIRDAIDSSPVASYRRLYLRACAQDLTGFAVRCIIAAHERPAEALVEYARRGGIDVVVLTAHGRGGNAGPLGSVAMALLSMRLVPILVVPAE
jgi:nucleotide-binding universal stress UspA family protein